MERVTRLCYDVCGSTTPHLTLWIDLDPAMGLARSRKLDKQLAPPGEVDRIEGEEIEFHQRVAATFARLCADAPDRIHRLEGRNSIAELLAQAIEVCGRALR